MTNVELRKKLEKFPDNMMVFLGERMSEFTYGLLNTVAEKEINFKEDPDGKTLATETCIILTED